MDMSRCFKPHALLHTLLGIGLGVLISFWFPVVSGNAVVVGLVLVVVAIVGDFMAKS